MTDTPLCTLQARQQEWANNQPWERGDGSYALLGVIEEVGELAASLPIKEGVLGRDAQQVVSLAMELGVLAHAVLKKRQGIRKNQDHDLAAYEARSAMADVLDGNFEVPDSDLTEFRDPYDAKDAVGDIVIYMMDICNRRGWEFQDIIEDTCASVFARDWNVSPNNGVSE